MMKIAVTGNIGSGKTTVSRVFETLGIPVFYADKEAKKLYSDPEILNIITFKFGLHILTPDGKLDTKALAQIIFNNKDALQFVNKLIHPGVFRLFDKWAKEQKGKPYCMQEAALIFESGSYKNFDKIIMVHAPEDLLMERVMKRDGITHEQAISRLRNQLPQSAKLEKAHFAILNDNSTLVIPQVLAIHKNILSFQNKYKDI